MRRCESLRVAVAAGAFMNAPLPNKHTIVLDLFLEHVYFRNMSSVAGIEREFNDIVGVLNAQHAALVDRVILLLADDRLWAGEAMTSMTSMSAWVAWRAGVAPAMAQSIVAIAERADQLPASIEAFRRGELSLDQMTTIARNAPG